MNMESVHKRGSCPRVWSPMESGDGLIVRVHPGLCEIPAAQLRTLVALAEVHGNGQIDVTRRANLQLRGIAAEALPALQAALVESGWAAREQAGERHFALLTSPLLGLAAHSAGMFALAEQLERALRSEAAPAWLHPKLCIAVDDGERLLRDAPFDLALWPQEHAPERVCLSVSDAERRPRVLGSCAREDAPTLVLRVIDLLSEQATRPLRMHEWAAATGLEVLRAALSPKLLPAELGAHLPEGEPPALLGYQRHARPFFGLLFPFGSGSPVEWRTALALSERFGSGALRVTAQRELLLLDVPETAQEALAAAVDAAGFIRRASDPLRRVAACTGAPLCRAAHGQTRSLARALADAHADLLRHGARLHVSGCEKSCAHTGASALTLVFAADGVHLGRDQSAAEAARAPAVRLEDAPGALRALAREYATCSRAEPCVAPATFLEPDSEQPE
jgi:precorrin-3B synthase